MNKSTNPFNNRISVQELDNLFSWVNIDVEVFWFESQREVYEWMGAFWEEGLVHCFDAFS